MEASYPSPYSLGTPTPSPDTPGSEIQSSYSPGSIDSSPGALLAPPTPVFEAAAAASFHDFFLGFFGTALYKKASDKSPYFLTTRLFNLRLHLPRDPNISRYLEETSRRAARLVLQNEVDEVKLNVVTDSRLVLQQFVVKIGIGGALTPTASELESIRSGLRQILTAFSDERTVVPVPGHVGGYFDIQLYDPGQSLIDSIFQSPTTSTPHVFHVHVAILVRQLFFNVYVLTYGPVMDSGCPPATSLNWDLTPPPYGHSQGSLPTTTSARRPAPLRDPEQLLRNLAPLLDPLTGGIGSQLHVSIILNLMTRFSAKTMSKCMYINILHSTSPPVLRLFLEQGGWNLFQTWMHDILWKANHKVLQELLLLIDWVEVPSEMLRLNSLPRLMRDLTMHTHPIVRAVAKRIDTNWRAILAEDGDEEQES